MDREMRLSDRLPYHLVLVRTLRRLRPRASLLYLVALAAV